MDPNPEHRDTRGVAPTNQAPGPSSDDLLREFLVSRDALCPCCEYNLRGLRTTRCPECNQQLLLRVGLAEPRMAAWIAGLVGLATGTGFSGLLVVYWFVKIMTRSFRFDEFIAITGTGLLVEGTMLALWIWMRGRIRRADPTTRTMLVTGCWGATAANLWVFTASIK